jgi:hypothetical protein
MARQSVSAAASLLCKHGVTVEVIVVWELTRKRSRRRCGHEARPALDLRTGMKERSRSQPRSTSARQRASGVPHQDARLFGYQRHRAPPSTVFVLPRLAECPSTIRDPLLASSWPGSVSLAARHLDAAPVGGTTWRDLSAVTD